eukprot:scaffold11_cov257-Pinguiococcus_pyrenoidosus.AAC.52
MRCVKVAALGGKVERGPSILLPRVDSGARVNQELHRRAATGLAGQVKRARAVLGRGRDFRPMLQQQRGNLVLAILGCDVKRGTAILLDGIHAGPALQQKGRNLRMALPRCQMKRRGSIDLLRSVCVGPGSQEQRHHLVRAVKGRKMEGSGSCLVDLINFGALGNQEGHEAFVSFPRDVVEWSASIRHRGVNVGPSLNQQRHNGVVMVEAGEMKCCTSVDVGLIDVCVTSEQPGGDVRMAFAAGDVQRRPAVFLVNAVHEGAPLDQQLDDLEVAILDRLVDRLPPIGLLRVDIGVPVEQQGHDVAMAVLCREVKRRASLVTERIAPVRGVDVCLGIQKQRCHASVSVLGRKVERSPPVLVDGIHRGASSQQQLHALLVSLFGGGVERGAQGLANGVDEVGVVGVAGVQDPFDLRGLRLSCESCFLDQHGLVGCGPSVVKRPGGPHGLRGRRNVQLERRSAPRFRSGSGERPLSSDAGAEKTWDRLHSR